MELHPVTITIGIICTLVLVVLVGAGLSCTAFVKMPDQYPYLEQYYKLALSKKVC